MSTGKRRKKRKRRSRAGKGKKKGEQGWVRGWEGKKRRGTGKGQGRNASTVQYTDRAL